MHSRTESCANRLLIFLQDYTYLYTLSATFLKPEIVYINLLRASSRLVCTLLNLREIEVLGPLY